MIYLDNCATTEIRPEVLEVLIKALKTDFANPSSLHSEGFKVEKKIESAREEVSKLLNVAREDVVFTSGGTESNNLAIKMALNKMKSLGDHIITTEIEHASVMNHMKHLESQGFKVSYLKVDKSGDFSLEELEELITDRTILISTMHVNSELGSILSVDGIRQVLDRKKSKALFHIDGVQAFGKLETDLRRLGPDFYSFSGHKIHSPKGTGGLYIRNKASFSPVIFGGGQEEGIRSGTENAPSIIAFGEACRLMRVNREEEYEKVFKIKDYFIEKVESEIEDIKINCKEGRTSPYVVNMVIEDIRAEVLLHYLADEGIYISTSSACSSNDTKKSHVLKAIGLKDREIEATIRICFSYEIDYRDIDEAVDKIKKYTEEIREIMR